VANRNIGWNDVARSIAFTLPIDAAQLGMLVATTGRILDLGCGYGRVAAQLRQLGHANVVGYDTSEEMIRRAAHDYPDLDLVHYTGLPLPEHSNCFDAVVACALLTSITEAAEREAIVAELYRVLAPAGVIHVTEFLRSPTFSYTGDGVCSSSLGIKMKHYREDELLNLLDPFETISVERITVPTLTGKEAVAVQYFGRKPPNQSFNTDAP
jgi:SAM-dependent methyltransferase